MLRFAKFTCPVLAHSCSRLLLEQRNGPSAAVTSARNLARPETSCQPSSWRVRCPELCSDLLNCSPLASNWPVDLNPFELPLLECLRLNVRTPASSLFSPYGRCVQRKS